MAVRAQARAVVGGLTGLLLLAGAVEAEWWPVSSMRLFSEVRTGVSTGYEVFVAGARVDVAELGRPYRGAHHLVPDMVAMAPGERDEICRAWSGGAGEVRVDLVRRRVPTGSGEPAREIERRVLFTCG
jgi:hypothetical protein